MNTENAIKTIFEFATEGYENSAKEINALAAALSASKSAQKELTETIKGAKTALSEYLGVVDKFEKTKTADFTKTTREEFEKAKKAVVEKMVVIVKDTEALKAQAKAQKEAEKAQAQATEAAQTYRKVMSELGKDSDKAQVSMSQLKEVQKALRSEFDKTDTNTPRYRELSQEMAVVDKAIKSTTESLRAQAKAQGVSENSIEGMRLKLSAMKVEWAAMDRVLEKDMFEKKEKEIQSLTAEISEAEGRIGVFSRNVGNYKSTFDGLGFSMAQITREAPAFAHSMTTGFMAISNNLPILFDEINKLKKANAAMNAEGVKTPPIWKSIAKAAISLNTAMSLGIVLLTVYGKDLVSWIASLFDSEDALDAVERRAEELNEELGNLSGTTAKQIVSIQLLSQKFIELGANVSAQQQFLKENRKELDETGLSIHSIAEAQTALVDKLPEYIEYLSTKAKAEAAYNLAVKKTEEALKAALEVEDVKNKGNRWWDYALASLQTFSTNILDVYERRSEIQRERIQEAKDAETKAYADAEFFREKSRKGEEEANEIFKALGLKRVETTKKVKNDEAKIYAQAHADQLKAQEDYAKAQILGDEEAEKKYLQVLKNKQDALDKASKYRVKLSQEERDQLELNEYLSAQAIEKIREDAAKKTAEEQKKKAEAYINAANEVQEAEQELIDAQNTGSQEQIKLNAQMLEIKKAELAKYNVDELALTTEQQTELSLKSEEFTQKQIDDYRKFKETENALALEFDAAKTDAERAYIAKKQADIQQQLDTQIAALKKLGIEAEGIVVNLKPQADKAKDTMVESLEKSLSTLEKFGGKTKNSWGKLTNSLGGMMAAVFDLTKEKSEKTEMAMIAAAGAVAQSSLGAVMDSLNTQFEREKSQIDELYDYQTNAAQRSYDAQSLALDGKFKRGEITEAKYRLEQLKAERAQAKKQEQIAKTRAEAEYDLSVKMFKAKQAQDIISTIIATAVSVMQSFANAGGFPFGLPMAAAMTALGAVQVGIIAAQKPPEPPKFEQGGMLRFGTIEGESHANGGVPIKVGGKVVAEAEGDEGMLIVSKKAMRNRHMRRLLAEVKQANESISGKNPSDTQFAQGGELTYEDFLDKAKAGVRVTFDHGFLGIGATYRVNGEPTEDGDIDAKIAQIASEEADKEWNDYLDKRVDQMAKKEAALTAAMDNRLQGNSFFKGMGIGSVADYNRTTKSKEDDLANIEAQIDDYRKLADAKIDSLKVQMQYEEKLAAFEDRRKEATSELSDTTLAFNEQLLEELHDSGQIATDEYLSMLDQVRLGYGVKTADIINLKKKEVEAVKKLINEERNAELAAANETAKYRTDALTQLRTEWKDNYNATTKLIIEDVEAASEAVSQLTGSDLERFEQIRTISREIQAMEEQYQKNDTLLSDGVVQSREERAALVAEQQRIKAELAIKEKEAEEARKAFEEERSKNMEKALKAYESENFDSILAKIKELGSSLQEEGSKWSLDKQLAADLDGVLKGINSTYDEQIAAQDKLVEGLDLEIKKAQLLHDQKVAQIKAEEAAFKDSFERQKSVIEASFDQTTANLRSQATSLAGLLAQIRATALEVGIGEYERSLEGFSDEIDAIKSQSKSYATGGVIDLGGGVFDVQGASHAQGGVPVSIGGRKIAEVEGAEQMYVVNKLAAADPLMQEALARVSSLNEQYTGVPLHDYDHGRDSYAPIDYDLLAQKIGAQINARPVRTQLLYSDVERAARMDVIRRNMNN